MVNTAVILAAGLGTRFGHFTERIPKGFVEVNGISMIERSIKTLLACGVQRIVIGIGYKHEAYDALKVEYPMIETCFSPRYAETNSMFTLFYLRDIIGNDDFLLLESDLIFDRHAIETLQHCEKENAMLVTPVTKFQDQYYVAIDEKGYLKNCSVNKDEIDYVGEFVGIHKFSHDFYAKMCADYQKIVEAQPKMGYEYELVHMSQDIIPVYVALSNKVHWYEIDDPSDLQFAETNVAPFCEIEK